MIEVVERNYGGRDTRGWFRMVHSALDARGCPTEVDVAGFRRLDASGQPTGRAGFEHLGSQAVRRSVAERRTAWGGWPSVLRKARRSCSRLAKPVFTEDVRPSSNISRATSTRICPTAFAGDFPVSMPKTRLNCRGEPRGAGALPHRKILARAPPKIIDSLFSSHFPYSVSYSGLSEPAPRVAGGRKRDRDTGTTSPVGSEARPLRQAERRLRRP